MTKKKNTQETTDMDVVETTVPEESVTTNSDSTPATVEQTSADVPHTVIKKRIRVRKKAAKKVSAAIICANPYIRRFI